ncbi:uncharacterized protein LOC116782512 [Chiroxiphia lanceolata]|uniref:uncharacterized protein LOC116782512 n=1 Tax=Chiroxiphia lanceolata TaxID=296741 RepID=UPI0013CF3C9A|nr:uncharacterized protein LOC116782512 [Chiroxiphia lanceolata]
MTSFLFVNSQYLGGRARHPSGGSELWPAPAAFRVGASRRCRREAAVGLERRCSAGITPRQGGNTFSGSSTKSTQPSRLPEGPRRAPRSSRRRCCIEGPGRPLRSGSCRGGPAGAPLLLLALPSPRPAGENTELPPSSTAGDHYFILEDIVPPALSSTVIIIVTTVISLIMDLEFSHCYQVFSLGETERTQDLGNCLNLSSFEIVKTNWTHFWNSKAKKVGDGIFEMPVRKI